VNRGEKFKAIIISGLSTVLDAQRLDRQTDRPKVLQAKPFHHRCTAMLLGVPSGNFATFMSLHFDLNFKNKRQNPSHFSSRMFFPSRIQIWLLFYSLWREGSEFLSQSTLILLFHIGINPK